MLKQLISITPSLRLAHWQARLACALLWLVALAWGVFGISWGVLHGFIVPRIGQWRPQLEQIATQALGVTVKLGEVRAASHGAIPSFEVTDVRLYDPQGRESLHLPRVLCALSAQSLWRLGVEQLVLDRPVLEVHRRADGHIAVAGIDVSADPQQDSSALLDWLFSQPELAVRGGEVRWRDDTRPNLPVLALTNVDWVVRNPRWSHQMRLDATLPSGWGQRVNVQADLRQPLWQTDASRWRDWSGVLYGQAPQLDLQRLRQYLDLQPLLGVQVWQGQGALRSWVTVKTGHLQGVMSDLALNTVAVQLGPQLSPLELRDLQGRIEVLNDGPSFQLNTQGLAFRTASGAVWPGGNVRYGHARHTQGQIDQLTLQADHMDLLAVRQLAQHLPIPEEAAHWMQELQPTGLLQSVDLQWRAAPPGTPQADTGYWQAQGVVQKLGLQAGPVPALEANSRGELEQWPGRPGVENLDLDFDLNQDGGRAQLSMRNGAWVFPGVFEEPVVPMLSLQTELDWRIQGEDIEVNTSRLSLANADAEGQLSLRWRTAPTQTAGPAQRYPGVLELQGQLRRAAGARVHRYLPLQVGASVRQYVREAVRQGVSKDVRFTLKGNLNDFPFERQGTGVFQVAAQLQGVDLAYVPSYLHPNAAPAWPTLTQVQAELLIDRTQLLIQRASGAVLGRPQLRASQTEVRIPNFAADAPELTVKALVAGPASDALAFVNQSPLLHITGQALQEARMSGTTEVKFGLTLPLNDTDHPRVEGQVKFAGNDLRVVPSSPWLENTKGVLSFNEKGFSLSPSTARVLGGDLRFGGGMQERSGATELRFQGQGTVTADGLRQARDGGWMNTLGQRATGSAPYQIKLWVVKDGLGLQVESNLQGLALNLPAPLGKTATQSLPLRAALLPLPASAGPGAAAMDSLQLDVGPSTAPVASARYERQHTPAGAQVLRGVLTLGEGHMPLPNSGVQASVNLKDLNVDAWLAVAQPPPAATAAQAVPGPAEPDDTQAYWPSAFKLEAERLSQGGRTFHHVLAGGSREGSNWRLNAHAQELDGYIEYRPATGATPGKVYARLARLTIPDATSEQVESLLDEKPTDVPALDIVVQQFELGKLALGELEVQAINRVSAQGGGVGLHEWRLNKLNLTAPEARLQASGNWAETASGAAGGKASTGRRTALKFVLELNDAGDLLSRFGMPGVVRNGKGQIDGTLGWVGSPLAPHYPSLSGQVKVNVERGQFLKVEPGLGKLLGVLSLQALPRRLTLDFRDVFSSGFAFDHIRGDAAVNQGVARTQNLQMKGVNAAVFLDGSADLARETQDLQVLVIPELSTGAAALAATAINPVMGLGTLLAQYLIGKPLVESVGTQHFRITGSWADPQVAKVDNPRNISNAPPNTAPEGGKP